MKRTTTIFVGVLVFALFLATSAVVAHFCYGELAFGLSIGVMLGSFMGWTAALVADTYREYQIKDEEDEEKRIARIKREYEELQREEAK